MNKTNSPSHKRSSIQQVIAASSVGTMIEWYDFYIFGMLSTTISSQFFPKDNPTAALLSTLAIFAAGFIVRPFGALVFGRLGDLIGRKYTFLLTLILMGGSTFLIGCVPSYETIGIAAPIIVLLLRLLQGLALGGEYGGAATYVAEHSPAHRRGYYTSWIQTTATLGLFVALGIILVVKSNMSDKAFNAEWGGWRYPFWISIILVGVSIYIRMKMSESPLFSKLKAEGKTSLNPLKESFRHKANFKMVLLALFGAVMGQGVVWYTGQFYAQNFLETRCYIDFTQSRVIMLVAIALATPFFIVFGWLSDKIGRKWIMMAGMLGGILFYRPIFGSFLKDTAIKEWKTSDMANMVVVEKKSKSDTLLDAEQGLRIQIQNEISWNYKGTTLHEKSTDTLVVVEGGYTVYPPLSAMGQDAGNINYDSLKFETIPDTKPAISKVKLSSSKQWKFTFLVWIMIIFVTMVYGPIAAFLVEMFPTKIRYTSMSLPYHIGNGVFGGLVPFIGLLLTTTYPADPLVGLWYPIGVASLCFVIGMLYLRNKIDRNIRD
ncbi:MAG TPA: MFS transporter [Chitinophagaceae bacterium]|nr:MFS transporter [Chitinophagaceae bacterium]